MRPFPLNYFLPPKLPKGARVVIFPGGLNPPDAIAGRRNAKAVVLRSPWAHVRSGLRGERKGSLARHLRGYLRPAEWMRDVWRD